MTENHDIYTRLDTLPLRNFLEISKGENLQLQYLYKIDIDSNNIQITDKEEFERLYNVYNNLLFERRLNDNSLLISFVAFKSKNLEILSKFLINDVKGLKNEPKTDIKLDIAGNLLNNFLNELERPERKFLLDVFYFNENYAEIYKKLFPNKEIPVFFNELKGLKFHILEQYFIFSSKFDKIIQSFITSPVFIDTFFLHKVTYTDSLRQLNKILEKSFIVSGNTEKWLYIRNNLFDLQNINYIDEKKNETNYIDVIYSLQNYLEISIDVKSITVAEFESLQILAEKKQKELKKLKK